MVLEREYPEGFDVLTWVPVSRLRRFRRGYDQARLLALAVGRELSMEPVPVLRKIRNNRPQSGLKGGEARRANVLGVYRPVSYTHLDVYKRQAAGGTDCKSVRSG